MVFNKRRFDFVSGRRDLVCDEKFKDIAPLIKAVVFDLDGTLTDSIGNIISCTRHTFASFGFACPNAKAVMGTIGMELKEGLTSLLPSEQKYLGDKVTLRYREIFKDHPEYQIDKLFPGIEDLLETLKSLNIKIGYASGRSMVGIKRTLDATFLGNYCDAICGGNEVPSKPNPAMMQIVASRLGVSSDSILGVGDSGLDIGLCQNAGCYSLGVQTGVWSGDALKTLDPDMLLPSVGMLRDYFI